MRKLCWAIAAAFLWATVPVHAQTVRTASGSVEGQTSGSVSAFLSIPYAAPPIGANRWREPQPAASWKGVYKAAQFRPDCAQVPFPGDAAPLRTKPQEDCLYLNVWKPTSARAGAKLAVMVWIYGGGFVSGGTSPAIYSGDRFARDGVVFVSMNYRLGRFGFFAHPGLVDAGFGGNFGFLDQIAALQWVKKNVASFGGDPDNVTVFGESAGGMSVHMLLQSPLSRGLFDKAIIQSGGGRSAMPMPTITEAAKAGSAFAPNLSATELRALPEATVTGNLSMVTMERTGYSGPMMDGRTILGPSVDAIDAGLYPDLPVIVGANSADGFPRIFDKDKIFAAFGADADVARRLYDPAGDKRGLELATQTSADVSFIEPARAVARRIAARGGKAFLYRFAHVGIQIGDRMGGAPHASEIPYVFDTEELRLTPKPNEHDEKVARAMHAYWIAFARTGRPDGEGGPQWPAATPKDTTVQLIDSTSVSHGTDPLAERLDLTERRAELPRK